LTARLQMYGALVYFAGAVWVTLAIVLWRYARGERPHGYD
jgi:hypothetical protein